MPTSAASGRRVAGLGDPAERAHSEAGGRHGLRLAGTAALPRAAEPRKLGIQDGDGFSGGLVRPLDRRYFVLRRSDGGAQTPVAGGGAAPALAAAAHLRGRLVEQKLGVVGGGIHAP